MSLTLTLEAMVGDSVKDTAYEMVSLADKLAVNVEVKFNEVILIAFKGGDPEELIESFHSELKHNGNVKMATTHKRF